MNGVVIISNNERFILRRKMPKQTQRRRSLRIGKTDVAEAFPPTRQGTILNSHRVIGIATNTLIVLNCALVTGCSLTSYPELLVLLHGGINVK